MAFSSGYEPQGAKWKAEIHQPPYIWEDGWMWGVCTNKRVLGKLESTGRRIDQNYWRTWKRSADPNWEEIHITTIKTLINLKGKYKRDRNLLWKDNRISHAWKKHVTQ